MTRRRSAAALILAATGTTLALAAGVLHLTSIIPLAAAGLSWIVLVIQVGVAPAALAIALVLVLRDAGILGAARALVVAVVATLATAGGALSATSWSVAFDEADAGDARSLFGRIVLVSFPAAVALGSIAIAVALEAVFRRTGLGPASRWVIAVAIGLVGAPAIGLGFTSPATTILPGCALVAVLLIRRRSAGVRNDGIGVVRPSDAAGAPAGWRRDTAPPARRAAALALTTTVLGGIGIAFALSGSHWPGIHLDATQTMQLGIVAGLLSAIPFVVATTLMIPLRRRGRLRTVAALVIAALLVGAASSFAGYVFGPAFEGTWNWILLAAALAGAAVGITVEGVLPLPRIAGVAVGFAAAIGYVATLGIMLALAMGFVAPLVAGGFAIWWFRSRRTAPQATTAASR